jgi:hypothetical protein
MELSIMYALFHIGCGFVAYGATLANFQRQYKIIAKENLLSDKLLASFIGSLGPAGLISSFFATWSLRGKPFYHGFMWRVKP